MLCLAMADAALAAPSDQDASAAGARISHVHVERGGGFFSRPTAAAYVQVYDRADPPIGRTAVTGLPGSAFSAVENGQPVAVNVRPARADEPIALVVVADNSNDRGWLPPGPKHADPMLYLRDAAARVLKEFPESGRYALYSMSNTAEATPPLA